jgi:hypothetical protein
LHAVLPYAEEQFAHDDEDDSAQPETRELFHQMLWKAESKFVMDFPNCHPSAQKQAREEAYDAAGSLIVNHSDVLITIWDGRDSGAKGGTASSIQKAERAGIPVVRIDGRRLPHVMLPAEEPGLGPLRVLIRGILALPEAEIGIGRQAGGPQARLHQYLSESRPRWAPAVVFKSAKKMFLVNSHRMPSRDAQRWPAQPGERWSKVQEYFQPAENRADRLASHYARWTRGTFTANCLLSAFAVTGTVAPRLWDEPGAMVWIEKIGPVFLLLAIGLYFHARWREVHVRWIEYRMLAELFYSTALVMGIGASPRLATRIQKDHGNFSSWVKWYVDAMVREAGLFPIRLDPAYLAEFRSVLAERLKEQAKGYHEPRWRESDLIAARIRLVGSWLFKITLVSCLVELRNLWPGLNAGAWFEPLKPYVEQLPLVAVLCTIWGAALAVFAYQADFSKLAQVSGMLHGQLMQLCEDTERSMSGAELRECARRTAEVMMQEHEDWYLFYSLRELEHPN